MNGEMQLSLVGKCIASQWKNLPQHFSHITLDTFVIMPNHIHGIIFVGALLEGARSDRAPSRSFPTIGNIIGAYKSLAFNKCLSLAKSHGYHLGKLWQRNYWEHIIRNEAELQSIRAYIHNNPLQWELDKLYVDVRDPLRVPFVNFIRAPARGARTVVN